MSEKIETTENAGKTELEVRLSGELPRIQTNGKRIKEELTAMCQAYAMTEYHGEDAMKKMREDLAYLRSLKKKIEGKVSEVKTSYLNAVKPLEEYGAGLRGMIDEPIGIIDQKLKECEEEMERENRKAIREYWMELGKDYGLSDDAFFPTLFQKVYKSPWEKQTNFKSKKKWKTPLENACRQYMSDMKTILERHEPDFEHQAIQILQATLDIDQALSFIESSVAKRKAEEEKEERIRLDAVRKAQEEVAFAAQRQVAAARAEEQRRAQEQIAAARAEEQRKAQEQIAACAEEQKMAQAKHVQTADNPVPSQEPAIMSSEDKKKQLMTALMQKKAAKQTPDFSLRFKGTDRSKVIDLLNGNGIQYTEI